MATDWPLLWMKIAVVGGGIGGFGAALALRKSGFTEIHVFEKDCSVSHRKQGYGLTIQQAAKALRYMGVEEQVKLHDTPSSSHYLFDSDGRVIGFFGRAFYPDNQRVVLGKSKFNVHIPRQSLRQVLFDEISLHPHEIHIHWDCRICSIEKPDKWRLSFVGGFVADGFDLVIGCDGIYSFVRDYLFSSLYDKDFRKQTSDDCQSRNCRDLYELNYLGCVVILGIVDCDRELVMDRRWQTMNGCARLFVMPYKLQPTHQVMWQLSFPVDSIDRAREITSTRENIREAALDTQQTGAWHSPVPELIANTPEEYLMGTPVYDRNPLDPAIVPSIFTDTLCLLGDALHPMSPFKGQGANQALIDAASLAQLLQQAVRDGSEQANHLVKAIQSFTVESLQRSHSKVMSSRDRAYKYHSEKMFTDENPFINGLSAKLLNEIKNDPQISAENPSELDQKIIDKIRHVGEVFL